ncbi:Calycin [Trinorchestia longiramus]|nr:Calycin [Trinorchestia longiramus]
MANISGVYVHERDEGLDEFLEQRGAHFLAEKMMVKMSPTVTIEVDDEGTYRLYTKTQVKNFEWIFKLGEEVLLPTPDGTRTFIFELDDEGKLTQTPTGESEAVGVKIEREFSDEGMVVTLIHMSSDETAKRFFRREE